MTGNKFPNEDPKILGLPVKEFSFEFLTHHPNSKLNALGILMEEHRMMWAENQVPRKLFGPERDEAKGD